MHHGTFNVTVACAGHGTVVQAAVLTGNHTAVSVTLHDYLALGVGLEPGRPTHTYEYIINFNIIILYYKYYKHEIKDLKVGRLLGLKGLRSCPYKPVDLSTYRPCYIQLYRVLPWLASNNK
jgi:hypothetical protein